MLTAWICLCVCVAASTMIWPVARWGLHKNGHVRAMGFWTCLTATVVCFLMLLKDLGLQSLAPFAALHPDILLAGVALAVAYSVGFYILIMRCLQTGPAGPTVTVNNSAMICGVLFGTLYLKPHVPNPWIILGAAGTLVAVALVGLGKSPTSGNDAPRSSAGPVTARWKACLMFGGAFSGISFMSQAYMGTYYPTAQMGFLFAGVGFGLAGVILLVTLVRDLRRLASWREMLGGSGVGLLNTISIPLTMKAYSCFAPEIVLPVTVVTPIALNLLIARAIWREKLSGVVWTGCILAIGAVGAIAYGSGLN